MRSSKVRPLSPEQQALVEAAYHEGWVPRWTRKIVSYAFLQSFGIKREDAVGEAWVIVVKAAASWEDGLGSTFRSYAMTGMKRFLMTRLKNSVSGKNVWIEMPTQRDVKYAKPMSDVLPDHRSTSDPLSLLATWCSPEYASQRKFLDWRTRIVLYLHSVERLSFKEIGPLLGVSWERARKLEEVAREKMEWSRSKSLTEQRAS